MLTWNRRDSAPLSAALRAPKVKFGRNVVKKPHKNYQDEGKKSAINKKKINPQIKKPHLKMTPIKDNQIFSISASFWDALLLPSKIG